MSVPIASTSTSNAAIESASTSVAIASTSTSSSASITVPNSPVHLTRFKRFREDTYFCQINFGYEETGSQSTLDVAEAENNAGTGSIASTSRSISFPDIVNTTTRSWNGRRYEVNSLSTIKALKAKEARSAEITYSWNNISVTAPAPAAAQKSYLSCFKKDGEGKSYVRPRELLKNVSGVIKSGELVCILGASGSGKTTLLNTLTFRNGSNLKLTSGDRYINGVRVNANLLSIVSAYIQQRDLFVGTLTVREQLRFHALLRMHANIPYAIRMQKVEQVIDEFGLRKCVDTLIGIPGRVKGISGGEKKRLAFACEILTDPVLMFCDEPISGLDSFMAQNIIQCLKSQAEKGKAIICTIHQPSSALFTLFDRLLVMAEGRVAYFGPTNHVLRFMEEQGHSCPLNYNPAEFLTETLAIQSENLEQGQTTVQEICEGFENSGEYYGLKNLIDKNSRESVAYDWIKLRRMHTDEASSKNYKASWFAQFRAVLWRSWISFIKNPAVLQARILQSIGLALIIGGFYFQQEKNQEAIRNITGAIFIFILALTYQNLFGTLDVFCTELPIFLREHWNGMYRTDVYYLSKILVEIPFFIVLPGILVPITYFMVGFDNTWESYLLTVAALILVTYVTSAFGYFISCLSKSLPIALIASPLITLPLTAFGSHFFKTGTGLFYLNWIRYISWFYYGAEAIAIIQWSKIEHIACGDSGITNTSTCPPTAITNGKDVLDTLGFHEENLATDYIGLAALTVGFHILAFICLLSQTKRYK